MISNFEFTSDDIKELMIQYENISELINSGQEDIKNIKANIKEVCDIDIDEVMKYIIDADGVVSPEENRFLNEEWADFKRMHWINIVNLFCH